MHKELTTMFKNFLMDETGAELAEYAATYREMVGA